MVAFPSADPLLTVQKLPMPAQTDQPAIFSEEIAWYCVRTRPKQEQITARALRAGVGVEVFSPFVRFKRSRGRGTMWVTEALFPGYLFAKFHIVDQFRHVNATHGVTKILSFGGSPAIVHEDVITTVRASMPDSEEIIVIPDTLQPGDDVKIVSGPYAGLRTVVTRVIPARQRVGILLEILGSEREVEVDAESVLSEISRPMIQR
jgi:transcriptional antiterminator RfaH